MDITTILNSKGPAAAAAVEQQLQQQLAQVAQANNDRTQSETGSERGGSPHTSEYSSHYSSRSAQPLHQMVNMAADMRYPSPQMQTPLPMLQNNYMPEQGLQNAYIPDGGRMAGRAQSGDPGQKSFACGSCGKGFARRSDLARHERIHSGHRPHVCDYPGCKKQFIQRSALTVHSRVHTGEKPHRCERCGKPFSDSSSLARHRRIHSGKRPYMCPYADCLKTFTRRTTLTRHQNHHTGTVEEAAQARDAALASRPPVRMGRPTHSDAGSYSQTGSPISTPSPNERTMSLSPSAELPPIPLMHRQATDLSYLGSTGSLPPHMRGDLQQQQQQPSPRSSPSATSASLSSFGGHPRPSMTSHPSGYGPPPTLEPPTNTDHRQPGSASGSPHMSSMGWPSPAHTGMASPGHADSYVYPEPLYGTSATHLYYPNSNIRRPQSTEPDAYDTKARVHGEVWAAPPVS